MGPTSGGANMIPQSTMQSGGGIINPQQQNAALMNQGGMNAANINGMGMGPNQQQGMFSGGGAIGAQNPQQPQQQPQQFAGIQAPYNSGVGNYGNQANQAPQTMGMGNFGASVERAPGANFPTPGVNPAQMTTTQREFLAQRQLQQQQQLANRSQFQSVVPNVTMNNMGQGNAPAYRQGMNVGGMGGGGGGGGKPGMGGQTPQQAQYAARLRQQQMLQSN